MKEKIFRLSMAVATFSALVFFTAFTASAQDAERALFTFQIANVHLERLNDDVSRVIMACQVHDAQNNVVAVMNEPIAFDVNNRSFEGPVTAIIRQRHLQNQRNPLDAVSYACTLFFQCTGNNVDVSNPNSAGRHACARPADGSEKFAKRQGRVQQ